MQRSKELGKVLWPRPLSQQGNTPLPTPHWARKTPISQMHPDQAGKGSKVKSRRTDPHPGPPSYLSLQHQLLREQGGFLAEGLPFLDQAGQVPGSTGTFDA